MSPIYLKILHIQDTLPRKLRLCSVNQLAEENKVRQQSLGAMPQPNPSYSVTQAQCIKEPNTNSFVRSSNEVICMGGLCQLSCADHRKGAYILLIWTQSTIALTKSQLLFRGRRRISRFPDFNITRKGVEWQQQGQTTTTAPVPCTPSWTQFTLSKNFTLSKASSPPSTHLLFALSHLCQQHILIISGFNSKG